MYCTCCSHFILLFLNILILYSKMFVCGWSSSFMSIMYTKIEEDKNNNHVCRIHFVIEYFEFIFHHHQYRFCHFCLIYMCAIFLSWSHSIFLQNSTHSSFNQWLILSFIYKILLQKTMYTQIESNLNETPLIYD